jgi:hypothetical protein
MILQLIRNMCKFTIKYMKQHISLTNSKINLQNKYIKTQKKKNVKINNTKYMSYKNC